MSAGTFTGAAGTAWSSAANWLNGVVPQLGTNVTISASASIGSGAFWYGNATMTGASLSLAPSTILAFAQLIAKNSSLSGGTLEGTQLYVYGSTTLENTVLQSDIVLGSLLAADLGLSGYLTTLDNYYGPGGIWVTHQLTVAGSATLLGNGITLQSAAIGFGAGGTLTVGGGATLDVAPGDGTAASVSGPGQLVNQGTVLVEAGAALEVLGTLANSGAVLVQAGGTLELDGTGTTGLLAGLAGGGRVLVGGMLDNTGATLDLSVLTGVSAAFGDASGGGTIRGGTLRTAGTVMAAAAAAPTVLNGVAVAGLLDFTGSLELAGGTTTPGGIKVEGGTLVLGSGAALAGVAVELAGGVLTAATPARLASTASLTISSSARVDGSVTLTGPVTVDAGTTLTVGDASVAPSSLVTLGAAAAVLAAHTVGGTVRFGAPTGQVELTGTGALSAALSQFQAGDAVRLDGLSAGTLSLTGSTLTVTGAGTTATFVLADPGATPYAPWEFELTPGSLGSSVLTTSHLLSASANPLFDAGTYMAQYGAQVTASGLDPYTHFLTVGWKQGLNPDAWFDTSYYLRQNPDVAAAGIDPLLHYETSGWKEGRAPSLVFSGPAFVAAHPGNAGMDPLLAYVQSGAAVAGSATYAPGAAGTADVLVQPSYLFAQMGATLLPGANAAAEASALFKAGGWQKMVNPDPMFDTTFYMDTHRAEVLASGLDPLTHYETIGWKEGYDPSLMFSTSAYLAAHQGVASSGVDPLTAYYQAQQTSTQAPATSPASSPSASAPTAIPAPVDPLLQTGLVASQIATLFPPGGADPAAVAKAYDEGAWQAVTEPNELFDSIWYLAKNPDVARAGIDPLWHYETSGWHEGRNPDPLFDTTYYLQRNPDVAAAGVDPLLHFEQSGWREGRAPDPLFDVNYYLSHNPDVKASGMDPLVHYDLYGWKEGRNPSEAFDTDAYLAHNRDVAAAAIDPLAHYLVSGAAEGRPIYAVPG